MSTQDTSWESLKASWQAAPLTAIAADALRSRLRWRMIGSWIYLGVEVAGVVVMGAIVVVQWRAGARGAAVAVAVLTAVSVAASVWARVVASRGSLSSVVGMLDLSIARASRSIRLAVAGYAMSVASAAYVAVMYFSTVGPPGARGDGERALLALTLVGAYGVGTAIYHRYVHRRRQRLTALRDLLSGADSTSLSSRERGRP